MKKVQDNGLLVLNKNGLKAPWNEHNLNENNYFQPN